MDSPVLAAITLLVAGTLAGLGGSVAGVASIFSYPALLLVGLNPVDANITNAAALIWLSFGSISSSKPEWSAEKTLLKKLAPGAVLGGIAGSLLLVRTDPHTFAKVAPFLILASSVAILIPRKPGKTARQTPMWIIHIAIVAISMYCGYFGAAAGTLTIATLMQLVGKSLPVANAMKNVLMFFANFVAVAIFIFTGHVQWIPAIPLALGFFIGGRLGPAIVRRSNPRILKYLAAGLGVAVAISLATST